MALFRILTRERHGALCETPQQRTTDLRRCWREAGFCISLMDKTVKEAICKGLEAHRQNPDYYDQEAAKRTRRRDTSKDIPVPEPRAWSARRANPSPAKTDREKRARLPVGLPVEASEAPSEAGQWDTYDPATGEYLGRLEKVPLSRPGGYPVGTSSTFLEEPRQSGKAAA